ncbi:PTS sugar transporter subunit IIB [Alkalibacter mobilis]|uniref:PTS sugar transporter subunit IIB n=1 Tax=Alkalibacter mobilis TaxID=2787712 RepID=UPI00189C8F36|nr:PTS sugar transporter [Alkalibacter mobilis]MBF7097480.1 PTS sugar transporter [Alkalibacter mobilis]
MRDATKIVCCCGAGICTSNYLREEIEDRLKAEGFKNVKVQISKVNDLEEAVVGADLLATTVELQKDYGIPQVRALGIMLDDNAAKEALDNIVDILKKNQ